MKEPVTGLPRPCDSDEAAAVCLIQVGRGGFGTYVRRKNPKLPLCRAIPCRTVCMYVAFLIPCFPAPPGKGIAMRERMNGYPCGMKKTMCLSGLLSGKRIYLSTLSS